MRTSTQSTLALFALLGIAACGAPVMTDDDGSVVDGRSDGAVDVESSRDSGITRPDSDAPPVDTGLAPNDTGVETDSAIAPADASDAMMDAGVTLDSGATTDASATLDTGLASDSAVRTDSGAIVDTGSAIDTGTQTDSGVTLDTGVRADSSVDAGPDASGAMLCGNGRIDPGEECDDNNRVRWDGCSDACRLEQTVRANTISIVQSSTTRRQGCDLTGDGVVDNRLGEAITDLALDSLNNSLRDSVNTAQTNVLAHFLDLDDRAGRNDPMIRLAFFTGTDALAPFQNVAGEAFTIPRSELDAMLDPLAPFSPAALSANALSGGPGTIVMRINLAGTLTALTLYRGRISGTTTTNTMLDRIEGINNGRICGALSAGDLDRIPWPTGLPGTCAVPTAPPPMGSPYSLLDLLAGGCTAFTLPVIRPIQPDIDIGGDGIAPGMGSPARQLRDSNGDRVIDTCYDSTANRTITGVNCAQDMAFDDAYSAAMNFTAVRIIVSGLR